MENTDIQGSYIIKKIKYNSGEFFVLSVNPLKVNKICNFNNTIVCNSRQKLFEGDIIEGTGIIQRSKYGSALHLVQVELTNPTKSEDIVGFLKRRIGRGVQRKTLEKIVSQYGEDSVIKGMNIDNLTCIGISKKTAEKISSQLSQDIIYEEVMLFLKSIHLDRTKQQDVYFQYKETTKATILNNPYELINIGFTFKEADEIAENIDFDKQSSFRIKAGVRCYIEQVVQYKGHIYLAKNDVYSGVKSFLKMNEQTLIERAIESLCREGYLYEDGPDLYVKRYYHMEIAIVENIEKRMSIQSDEIDCTEIECALTEYEKIQGVTLVKRQREAVHKAVNYPMSILTGFPGTGKSNVINAIIYVIQTCRPEKTFLLAAPTGKASKRIQEVTHINAKTLHRTIKLNTFRAGEVEEIAPDYLVIDEMSMVDIYLFYKVLQSTSMFTRIILAGDYQQLPSVGPGLILRDLMDSAVIPLTTLTEVFRQAKGSNTLVNAHKILNKDTDLLFNQKGSDFFFINKGFEDEVNQYIIKSIRKLLVTYKIDDVQVLCSSKEGVNGTIFINQLIQQEFNTSPISYITLKNMTFKEGDKVIQTVNNYELAVFNGETGTIKSIEEVSEKEVFIIVDYGDRNIIYDEHSISEVELAYAITIHKSQGSEFKVVIIPLNRNLNKNSLYTGITRTRERCILIGEHELLINTVKTEGVFSRNSKIKGRLIQRIENVKQETSKKIVGY